MRINRATLERIINEELVTYLRANMNEAPGMGSPLDDMPPPGEDPMDMPPEGEGDLPIADGEEDPMDAELDAEIAGDEPEVPGSVAADMQGKTIESIEQVDESESIPGAKEVVLSFQGEEDKLRVIITPSGDVKYFWKGLHSDIGSVDDVPPEDLEPEEDLSGEEDLDMESVPLPTDGEMDDPLTPEV